MFLPRYCHTSPMLQHLELQHVCRTRQRAEREETDTAALASPQSCLSKPGMDDVTSAPPKSKSALLWWTSGKRTNSRLPFRPFDGKPRRRQDCSFARLRPALLSTPLFRWGSNSRIHFHDSAHTSKRIPTYPFKLLHRRWGWLVTNAISKRFLRFVSRGESTCSGIYSGVSKKFIQRMPSPPQSHSQSSPRKNSSYVPLENGYPSPYPLGNPSISKFLKSKKQPWRLELQI